MFSKFAKLHWKSQCNALMTGIWKQHGEDLKNLSSNFKLRGMSEFHEASRKSLLLTGTPSVHNLKF